MEIFKLYGSIFVDNEKANKSIDETDKKSKGLSDTFGNVIGTAAKIGAGIVAGVSAAGGALMGLADKAAEYAGTINDASNKSSLAVDNLQQLKFAGEQAGVGFEDLVNSANKLNKAMADAMSGDKKAVEAFAELGVAIRDSSGEARTANDVYNDTLAKLAEMGDTTDRTRLGTEIFGKGFANLKPLLAEGADGIEALKQRAQELGIVLDEEAIKAGDDFGDTMDQLKGALNGVFLKIGIELMPVIKSFTEWVFENMPAISKTFSTVFGVVSNVVSIAYGFIKDNLLPIFNSVYLFIRDNITPVFDKLAQTVSAQWPVMQANFEKVFKLIYDVAKTAYDFYVVNLLPIFDKLFRFIMDNWPAMQSTFQTVFDAIIQVATMVWEFFRDNILPIFASVFQYINDNWPALQSIFQTTFSVIANVARIAWEVFNNLLLPILRALWDFIKPTFPLIATAIESAFNIVISVVNAVASAFNAVTSAIVNAINWLKSWNSTKAENKSVTFTETIQRVFTSIGSQAMGTNAKGTSYWQGGRTWVGEMGPEIVDLPAGSKVYTADQSRRMAQTGELGSGITINVVNKGTLVGTNGMQELADVISAQMASKFGLATGGAY